MTTSFRRNQLSTTQSDNHLESRVLLSAGVAGADQSTQATSDAQLTQASNPNDAISASSGASASDSGVAFSSSEIRSIPRSNNSSPVKLTSVSGAEGGGKAFARTAAVIERAPVSVAVEVDGGADGFAAFHSDAEAALTVGDQSAAAFSEIGAGDQQPLKEYLAAV